MPYKPIGHSKRCPPLAIAALLRRLTGRDAPGVYASHREQAIDEGAQDPASRRRAAPGRRAALPFDATAETADDRSDGAGTSAATPATESPRVYRRALSERGWSRCPQEPDTPPSCMNVPYGWCWSTRPRTHRSGRRSDRWPASWAAPPRPCAGGAAKPNARPARARA